MKKISILILLVVMIAHFSPIMSQTTDKPKKEYRSDFKGHPFPMLNGDTLYVDSLKGQYVLIDVWSPMCGICLDEMVKLHPIIEKYDSVCVLSLCVFPVAKYWQNMVKDRNMKGIHVLQSTDSKFLEDVGIFGVPRFLLLDKNGIVIEFKLPMPSSGELETILNKYISLKKEKKA